MPTFGSLFAGIGGIDLGLERAGWECRWQVEWDAYCQRVLAKHWPDVPRYGDITGMDWSAVEPVDLLAGGFPCQPFSFAGRRKGRDDDRWLWPEFARAVRALRPGYVLVENVPGLLAGGGMGSVLGDLAELGYDAEWDSVPAAAVGAPHLRYRVWIVAHRTRDASRSDAYGAGPYRARVVQLRDAELRYEQVGQLGPVGATVADADSGRRGRTIRTDGLVRPALEAGGESRHAAVEGGEALADTDGSGLEGRFVLPERADQWVARSSGMAHADSSGRDGWPWQLGSGRRGQPPDGGGWEPEPNVGRLAHGIPDRVARLRALGNAVVPQVVEVIGRALLAEIESRAA